MSKTCSLQTHCIPRALPIFQTFRRPSCGSLIVSIKKICILQVLGKRFSESSYFLPFSTKCLLTRFEFYRLCFVVFFQSDVAQCSAAAADLQSASAKVKKFVKTVYQQFFSLDYISKIRIQNGLV